MAAPALSTRGTPTGIKFEDGFSTKISFASNPTVCFWERTVKPPGMNGGDAINTTTMHNSTVHTKAPRSLIDYDNSTLNVAWDPNAFGTGQVKSLINFRDSITCRFPDGSTLTFYGYLQKFEPSDMKEGDMPEASITIVPTNWDPVGRVEAAPVFVNVVGT